MKIRMRVVGFKTEIPWKGHKGWNRPAVEVGTMRYAIAYQKGGYFTYSYLAEADAYRVMQGMMNAGTDTEQYYPFNCKLDIQETIPVTPK